MHTISDIKTYKTKSRIDFVSSLRTLFQVQESMSLVHLVFYFYVCLNLSGGVSFDGTGITTIPWENVSDTEYELLANNNNLNTLGQVPLGKTLTDIRVNDNKLASFPDLFNLRTTLRILSMKINLITHIDPPSYLYNLITLQDLHLNENPLVSLPSAQYFPPKLLHIFVFETPLTTFPSMCSLDNSNRSLALQIWHRNNNYICDASMLWTKLSLENALVVSYMPPTCSAPVNLTAKNWVDITNEDLLDADTLYFERLSDIPSFQCIPDIVQVIPARTKIKCGLSCMSSPGCALFAADNGDCILTEFKEGTFGNRTDFEQYSEWFAIQ